MAEIKQPGAQGNEVAPCNEAQMLVGVVELLPHPFYVIDASTYKIRWANAAARKGKPQYDITCHQLTHLSDHPCSSNEHPCPLVLMQRDGRAVSVEHIHHDAELGLRHVEVHAFPIFREDGSLDAMIEYSLDITERKQHEAERERLISELRSALDNVRTLHGLIPICSSCKKIRDDGGYWQQIESYIRSHSDADFTHSICPDCKVKLFPELYGPDAKSQKRNIG